MPRTDGPNQRCSPTPASDRGSTLAAASPIFVRPQRTTSTGQCAWWVTLAAVDPRGKRRIEWPRWPTTIRPAPTASAWRTISSAGCPRTDGGGDLDAALAGEPTRLGEDTREEGLALTDSVVDLGERRRVARERALDGQHLDLAAELLGQIERRLEGTAGGLRSVERDQDAGEAAHRAASAGVAIGSGTSSGTRRTRPGVNHLWAMTVGITAEPTTTVRSRENWVRSMIPAFSP